ncbi:MAG: VIT1/CCC1 transporter family protein [Planctomycetota bacterium JB042]
MTTPPEPIDMERHRAEHSPEAIRASLEQGPDPSDLKDVVYGAIDGAVTTFAVVSGVAGADLSSGIVLVLGAANLVADGFSMGAANFLGTRAELALRDRMRRAELRHIEIYPEGEREEVRQIYKLKGFEGEDLERVVDVITSDVDRWVDLMMMEHHGVSPAAPSPLRAATATFVSFLVVGSVPLSVFVVDYVAPGTVAAPFAVSAALTGAAFVAIGALKGRFVEQRWWAASLETLLIGSIAASLAYAAGVLLRGLVD